MHARAGYTLAYVSGLPQGLRGEEILDGGEGKEEKSFSPFVLSSFYFSFLLFRQKRLILRLGTHY